MEDGTERPIACASRTLSSSEKNFAQVEKEALALVFGVKKFHNYIYGRKFTLITDHKPLTTILGPKQGVPTLAAARMQRWALILSAYTYDIEYRRSADHSNADALSRLPQSDDGPEETGESIYHFTYIEELPLDARDIQEATRKDPVLSKVLDCVLSGWPNHVDEEELRPYFVRRHELSVEQGCLLWGLRVVIPPKYHERLLSELHEEHPGVFRMKALARSYLWWPKIDSDVENCVRGCSTCQEHRNAPVKSPLHSWPFTSRPYQRVHIDFGHIGRDTIFVLCDTYSKWIEAIPMTSTTADRTVDVLRQLFSDYGFPEQVVSDNGPPFNSEEFAIFMAQNGIKHTLVPPYHPASNGAAERAVQVVKHGLKANQHLPIGHRISNFLLKYRTTPHTVTGVSPAELFLKRKLRTRLSMLKPDLSRFMGRKLEEQKQQHDSKGVKYREFKTGDQARVKTHYGGSCKWELGTIIKVCGPRSYLARVLGKTRYVHVDHLRGTEEMASDQDIPTSVPIMVPRIPEPVVPKTTEHMHPSDTSAPVAVTPLVSDKTPTPPSPKVATASIPPVIPEVPDHIVGCHGNATPRRNTPRRNPPRNRVAPKRLDL